ncbi:TRAP transporter small permease subunit [Desulfosarcina sp.]|jgi:TRAP-type mannitol/chloroaromatic compound transport system permease small subunit|uniref:TRAP transporter small permease subunit n=1 Tax=Desulfosarcina sp. TaxID=2027861 RepID=UPI003970FF42
MLNLLKGVSNAIDRSNEAVGRLVSWVTVLLILLVFIDVLMRYLFRTSFVFVQELEWHLFAFIFLIGAGYTLLHDGHVRVDIIYQRLGVKGKAWINLLGVIFFLIPGCYLVISTSWHFVSNSFSMLEGSPDPGGIPYRFIVKGTVTVGYVLLLLQGISMGLHALLQLLGAETVDEENP